MARTEKARDVRDFDDAAAPWRRPGVYLFAAAIVLPALLFSVSAYTGYRDTLQSATLQVDRTARVLEEHVSKVFENHRMVIQQVRERLRFVDWTKEADRADLHRMMQDLQNDLDQVATITVVNAAGRLLASGRTYPADPSIAFTDRDWFQALRDGENGTFISRSYDGRQSRQPIFNVAVPLRDRSGTFAGAIAISIDRRYFEAFYKEVEPAIDHSVTLTRADGEILARIPATDLTHLPSPSRLLLEIARAPSGHYVGISKIDGVRRLFAYRKVGRYPVFVRFGIAMDAVMSPWRRSLLDYGLVALLSSVALAAASWLAVRQTQRERVARHRWQETAEALELEVVERARVDAQVRQLQKMEAIGRLTGGIAHDFNNLLTAVLGNLELAGRRIQDDRVSRLIENAIDGAQRAANLTSRLLAFSRQQPLQPERVALNDLVEGMADLLRVTVGEAVTLQASLAPELWLVAIDVSQLENAILNLAVNSRDAMPGGGTLMIETANRVVADGSDIAISGEVEPGSYATVSVRDDGAGIAPDILAQVFEPFFTTKPVGKGTGLGLSQVYGFAKQSGGHVLIRSTVGRGTTITLLLPRLAEAEDAIPAIPIPATIAVAAAGRGETVLIVEDDEMVRSYAVAALGEADYRVLQAADGPAALTLLAAHPEVALLFTDVVLQGPMDGRALAEAACRRRHLPVLFTSGYGRDSIVHDGKLDAHVELLPKPFASDVLVARVRAMIDLADSARPPERLAV